MIADSPSARLQALVAEQAVLRGAGVGLLDVCTAAVAALPVGGAGVSAVSRARASHPLCSTDSVSHQLEELQLTLGEGSCVDAFVRGSTVLCPDLLTGALQQHWTVFADSALEAGARAVFAFPLPLGRVVRLPPAPRRHARTLAAPGPDPSTSSTRVRTRHAERTQLTPQGPPSGRTTGVRRHGLGVISSGMLDLYSSSSVELDADEVADAMALADTATLLLLDARISETGVPSDTGASSTSVSGTDRPDAAPFDDLGGHRAEIGQATGVLMVQLGVASTGHSSGCAPTRTPGEHGSRWSPT